LHAADGALLCEAVDAVGCEEGAEGGHLAGDAPDNNHIAL